jgi:hypothetical protein
MMINECGAGDRKKISRGNQQTWRKSTTKQICPPQMTPDSTWDRRQEAAQPATNCLKYGRCQIACEYMRLVHITPICMPTSSSKRKKKSSRVTHEGCGGEVVPEALHMVPCIRDPQGVNGMTA